MKLFFENAAGRLLEDPAGFMRANWSPGLRSFSELQALFAHMALGMQRYGWSRMLINQTQMLPFSREEQLWIAEKWLPGAVQTAGYRTGAVVVSQDVLTRLATAYVTTHVQGLPLTYRSFETDAQAQAWLLQQPN
ncbi:hypothetical protein SAMN06265337_3498 [Hymenobacter gelipurpurascens]|uniref:SpoIIAA-like n=1 Tax=Hymenobacter gelipurpurascens TaxID=89968 RepID=A0A212UEI0_9BACT|nr:hypothetical protein [Hymenobacter gelipurpurascens]SNC76659.1 hypothetical protein SAMN06265337_3498 [Hymenobacter gelipurpurascens]